MRGSVGRDPGVGGGRPPRPGRRAAGKGSSCGVASAAARGSRRPSAPSGPAFGVGGFVMQGSVGYNLGFAAAVRPIRAGVRRGRARHAG